MTETSKSQLQTDTETKNAGTSPPSLPRLFFEFFKIGLFTFGGGMVMLPIIERVVVDEKHWLERDEIVNAFALSQALPGVIAVSSSSYVGRRLRGMAGAVTATLAVILPSLIVIAALTAFLAGIWDNPYLQGAFRGIKAAVCGLIICSCIRLGRDVLRDIFGWAAAALALLAVAVFQITAIWVVVAGAAAGILLTLYQDHHDPHQKGGAKR